MFWQQWRVNCLPFRSLAQNKNKNKNKKPAREHKINTPTHSHNKCKKFLNVENAPKHETDVFMYACKCICLSGECYPYAAWNYNYTRTHLNRVPTFKKYFFFQLQPLLLFVLWLYKFLLSANYPRENMYFSATSKGVF